MPGSAGGARNSARLKTLRTFFCPSVKVKFDWRGMTHEVNVESCSQHGHLKPRLNTFLVPTISSARHCLGGSAPLGLLS